MKFATNFCLLFVILTLYYLEVSVAENYVKERNSLKRSGDGLKKQVGMWFGPRLGRRKRTQNNNDDTLLYNTGALKKEQLRELIETLPESAILILAIDENKMQQHLNDLQRQWDNKGDWDPFRLSGDQ